MVFCPYPTTGYLPKLRNLDSPYRTTPRFGIYRNSEVRSDPYGDRPRTAETLFAGNPSTPLLATSPTRRRPLFRNPAAPTPGPCSEPRDYFRPTTPKPRRDSAGYFRPRSPTYRPQPRTYPTPSLPDPAAPVRPKPRDLAEAGSRIRRLSRSRSENSAG